MESWYHAYAVKLRSAAWRIVGNRADAEDAIQDAFVAAFRALDRYDGSDPYPWLYRIATRKALTIASSRRTAVDLAETIAPVAPSAEDEALEHLTTGTIRALIAHEPAVALHVVAGLHFTEIGERYGMPVATAASRVRRGKHRLRARLRATLCELPKSQPA